MDQRDEDFSNHGINYNMIAKGGRHLSTTKMLAMRLQQNPYYTVGDFLKSLSQSDLEILQEVAEIATTRGGEEDDRVGDLILISQMLAEAEGTAFGMDLDNVISRANSLSTFIALESLYRKGLIKLHHENISFGADAGHKIVAERIHDDTE
jgi:hypothetical protein